ncbi:putative sulfate exporter family transporter [Nitrogeniibacter mangrovi]|uniref:Putative sulfate exporter family transporter n=1 Tax=Nitrogeniibacter mangrovi TaxID=2016596 RepID=A0A6C1B6I6_9RHOO|nr:putative sulfate exporter family transporter [Nitrogeniibacter mangrovi]QID19311.1 putative sulfate exporter family transporter [Nitrogeniibacter mangrovi]
MSISATLPPPGVRLGLFACVGITFLAAMLAAIPAMGRHGLGWLPVAVALGMVVGNLWPDLPTRGRDGLALARGPLMRAGIALYGLRIGIDEFAAVGWGGALAAVVVVASTLWLAQRLGRAFGLDRHSALLIGAGSAICGAAAVAAADGVLGARARHVSAAVASVVLFGTLGMYVLPWLFDRVGLPAAQFGLWIGLTVHELGHVVAAASPLGPEVSGAALIAKMMRVMLLAPAMVWMAWSDGRASGGGRVRVPFFLWAFFAAIALNGSGLLPPTLQAAGAGLAQLLLAVGLAALGAATRLVDIRAAGARVWWLAASLWAYLLIAGLGIVTLLARFG